MLPEKDTEEPYKCPSCGPIKECLLDQIPSTASYFIAIISFFIFGIWSVFIIPLIFQSTKIIVKRCPYCNSEVERQSFFSIPSLSDQVLQFKFGNCVIVLSRKYAIVLLLIFISLFAYFEVYQQQPEIEKESIEIDSSWEIFLGLCGKYQIIDNGLKAKLNFERQFHGKQILWNGYYDSIRRNGDPRVEYSDLIYVKMSPSESAHEMPDLVLGVEPHLRSIIREQVESVKKGQAIQFKAQFTSLGNEFNFHLLNLIQLEILDTIIDIDTLPHYNINQIVKYEEIKNSEEKANKIRNKQSNAEKQEIIQQKENEPIEGQNLSKNENVQEENGEQKQENRD